MTHSLHRRGSPENLQNDYVVFAMSAKGVNDKGSAHAMQEFMKIASRHKPVNMGDMKTGNWFLNDIGMLEGKVQDTSIVHAVYTDLETVSEVLKELKQADLGVSIVVSGLFGPVREACKQAALEHAPHTVEYSLGIWGKTSLLPSPAVLEIGTMCGHGQIAFQLIEEMAGQVRRGALTAEQAARKLAEPCVCGIFNPARAAELLRRMAV
jgi:hypothetical protein